MSFDVVIITNGPGELSTWVKPLVSKISDTLPEARIIIALVPCPYASGEEDKIGIGLPGVGYLLDVRETCLYLFSKKLPGDFSFRERGIIIHLGGDQFFTVAMGWRTKFPTIVYTEKLLLWPNLIDKYLLTDQNAYANARLRGIDATKLSVVGNLMVDAVSSQMPPQEIRERLGLSTLSSVVSLLPGSKPFKVKYSTPFLLKVADYIAKKKPDVQFVLSQSPYTPLYQIVGSVTDEKFITALDGTSARFGRTKNGNVLVTEQGTVVNIIPPEFQYEAYQISDVAVTLPGTNTAELAILGIPMVVLLPLNKPEHIPVEGLWGRIADLPLVGKYIKMLMINYALKKLKFISLPNQKLGYQATPEITGNILPVEVANKAVDIIEKPYERREISLNLKKAMGTNGAAKNVVANIIDVLLKRYSDMEILETFNNYSDWTKRESDLE
jgi:lipid A disaccharide synthetase